MNRTRSLLIEALVNPQGVTNYAPAKWNKLLRVARRAKLLAKLSHRIDRAGVTDQLQPRIADALYSAKIVAEQHNRLVQWETNRISRALLETNIDFVLLKGGAYVVANLPPAQGRLVSDVDIMVPKKQINEVETALANAGWTPMNLDSYDQRYYRQWMHELPPLRHPARNTVIDVHHTILPESGRLHPDPDKLFDQAHPPIATDSKTESATNLSRALVLSPADMVLHSAAHLFQDGDLAGDLRDLIDLDELLTHFGATEKNFWETLVSRGVEMDLHRPLYYALRFTSRLLGTDIPKDVLKNSETCGKPNMISAALMDQLATRALIPDSDDRNAIGAEAARWLLYVRSHWLRMPPLLLGQHLLRKALRRFSKVEDISDPNEKEKHVEEKRVA
jgi:hypothetical protein